MAARREERSERMKIYAAKGFDPAKLNDAQRQVYHDDLALAELEARTSADLARRGIPEPQLGEAKESYLERLAAARAAKAVTGSGAGPMIGGERTDPLDKAARQILPRDEGTET